MSLAAGCLGFQTAEAIQAPALATIFRAGSILTSEIEVV
jgi:hypothetical protein